MLSLETGFSGGSKDNISHRRCGRFSSTRIYSPFNEHRLRIRGIQLEDRGFRVSSVLGPDNKCTIRIPSWQFLHIFVDDELLIGSSQLVCGRYIQVEVGAQQTPHINSSMFAATQWSSLSAVHPWTQKLHFEIRSLALLLRLNRI
jgi:hypothetical protein